MATIQLTDPYFYKAGQGGVTRVVGVESKVSRVVRYRFTAPTTGASHIDLSFQGMELKQGEAIALRYHITEDETSYADPATDAPYTGTLTFNAAHTAATGSADILLLPGKTYSLWVFPAVRVWGWYSWILDAATLTTSGGSVSTITASGGTLGAKLSIAISRHASFTHKVTWPLAANPAPSPLPQPLPAAGRPPCPWPARFPTPPPAAPGSPAIPTMGIPSSARAKASRCSWRCLPL